MQPSMHFAATVMHGAGITCSRSLAGQTTLCRTRRRAHRMTAAKGTPQSCWQTCGQLRAWRARL